MVVILRSIEGIQIQAFEGLKIMTDDLSLVHTPSLVVPKLKNGEEIFDPMPVPSTQ